jgi:hypothetical protein
MAADILTNVNEQRGVRHSVQAAQLKTLLLEGAGQRRKWAPVLLIEHNLNGGVEQ